MNGLRAVLGAAYVCVERRDAVEDLVAVGADADVLAGPSNGAAVAGLVGGNCGPPGFDSEPGQ